MFFQKGAGMLGMALSTAVLVALLGVLVGTWMLREAVLQGATDLVAVGNRALMQGQTAVAQLKPQLGRAQARLSEGVTQIEAMGAMAEQTNLIVAMVEEILQKDLGSTLARLEEQGTNLRDTIIILDMTVDLLPRLPLTRPDAPLLTQADAAIEQIKVLGQRIETANQAVASAKSKRLDNLVQDLTRPLLQAEDSLQRLNDQLSQLSTRLAEAQGRLQALLHQLEVLATGITVGLTFLLLWLALSQVSLFIHAYHFFATVPRQPAGLSQVREVSSI